MNKDEFNNYVVDSEKILEKINNIFSYEVKYGPSPSFKDEDGTEHQCVTKKMKTVIPFETVDELKKLHNISFEDSVIQPFLLEELKIALDSDTSKEKILYFHKISSVTSCDSDVNLKMTFFIRGVFEPC